MNPAIRLHKGKDRSVRNFHPWIFSGAIASDIRGLDEGAVVDVFATSGEFLATGHFHKGTIMVRVLSFEQKPVDATFWSDKISAAFDLRKQLPGLIYSDTNAFRLVHGEGDQLPGLVVDIYNRCIVIQTHSEGMLRSVQDIATALEGLTGLEAETIYHRHAPGGGLGFIRGTLQVTEILEHGHRFLVDILEGQKTGFFLDQRENRKLLATFAAGKRVLNTFCYTGGFSIYALKAGATHVDSVDSSAKATATVEVNIRLNAVADRHTVHTSDVSTFMKGDHEPYDLIVLDPPAYAKHLSAVDQAVIGYRNLNEEAIRRINPGGVLFTFSCSQAVDRQLFRKTVFMAAAKTGRQVRILHQLNQGPDHPVNMYHPEGEYLKGLVLRID
jgi:23S rRNA (cytosine1962-C5)-methyltransferase